MERSQKSLTIFIPVYNEEGILVHLFPKLDDICQDLEKMGIEGRILFHDNASTDKSWELVKLYARKSSNINAYRFSRNIGYQPSLTQAFKHAFSDSIVIYQSDMQDPIELILDFAREWKSGANIVVGIATNRSENLSESLGRKFFLWLFRNSTDLDSINWFTDFYLLDRSVYSQFANLPTSHQFIRGRIVDSFVIDSEITYKRINRSIGISKFNFARKYSLAFDAILLHGTRLIRSITVIGFALAFLTLPISFLLSILEIINNFEIGILISLQFLLLGFVGLILEYLIRIYVRLQSPDIVPIADQLGFNGANRGDV